MFHNTYLLGTGLTGFGDFRVSENIIIRDATINDVPSKLAKSSSSLHEFGLLCATAEFISFEVEFLGGPDTSPAILGWNFQWELSFLAIISEAIILWPFGASKSLKENSARLYNLTSGFSIGTGLQKPKIVDKVDLDFFLANREKFVNLIGNNSFSTAVSIAAIHSKVPHPSLSMAMVWSGIESILGFDHELRFRIALALTHLLDGNAPDRLAAMKRYSRLYDDRSKCVHGAKSPKDLDKSLIASKKILRSLILIVVERGEVFSRDFWDRKFLSKD